MDATAAYLVGSLEDDLISVVEAARATPGCGLLLTATRRDASRDLGDALADAARTVTGAGPILQKSTLPQLDVKLVFIAGSADDPPGKEGLAALSGAMIASGGSRVMPIDEITAALYPVAGSFGVQVDKVMTTFTGSIHREKWNVFQSVALPQLLDPGFRESDFNRLKASQLNALTQTLRSNNEEELGKEQLQINLFRGTPYGHTSLGTIAGLNAVTLDDVKAAITKERHWQLQAALAAKQAGDKAAAEKWLKKNSPDVEEEIGRAHV